MNGLLPSMGALMTCIGLSACSSGARAQAPAVDASSVRRGAVIFQTYCALCHGVRADGHGVRHAGFKQPPPDFTRPEWREGQSDADVREAIAGGVEGTVMPAWKATLTKEEIDDVTAFVLSRSEAER